MVRVCVVWSVGCFKTGLCWQTEVRNQTVSECCPGFVRLYDDCVSECTTCANMRCDNARNCACAAGYLGNHCNQSKLICQQLHKPAHRQSCTASFMKLEIITVPSLQILINLIHVQQHFNSFSTLY